MFIKSNHDQSCDVSNQKSDATKVRHWRICVACRNKRPQNELIRLTVDFTTASVTVNNKTKAAHGRSAYLCSSQRCLAQALKGTRLKYALEGRVLKGAPQRRSISWPLEPQLIEEIGSMCTEAEKTCQNTQSKENLE